jgi:hypothetical protein
VIKKQLFLASSSELKEDRKEFEIFINRKNKDWFDKGVFLELVVWEDFLDAVSQTRLQEEYNREIRGCDLFVMLFFTKVGKYTAEEFETAFGQFKATRKPFIFTYFKTAQIDLGAANEEDLASLFAFKKKLDSLGHFYTTYKSIEELKLHFNGQLDKLAKAGFIALARDGGDAPAAGGGHQAHVSGPGAVAQGTGATAGGAGSVIVGGSNTGAINTGTQIEVDKHVDTGGGAYVGGGVNTGGGDFVGRDKISQGVSPRNLEPLFAALVAAVSQQAAPAQQGAALQAVQQLKAEVAKGPQADDGRLGRIIDGLAALVPGAVGAVASLFASPILSGIAGPVTKFVLDKLKAG